MQRYNVIKAYAKYNILKGKDNIICICLQLDPKCNNPEHCDKLELLEDKYKGLKQLAKQNRYGK